MSTVPDNIKNLSIPERIQIVEDIWDTIVEGTGPIGISTDERQELQRRLSEHLADPSSSIPWKQVRASLILK